jgi:protocatechuate 3,4-dioxygenase beta subunit
MKYPSVHPYHLTRRGFVVAAAGAVAYGATPATPSCTLVAEQEVGPYYIEDAQLRRDLTEGKPGLPLNLRIALVDSRSCEPLPNAAIDIWHCDASSVYSGFTANSPDGPPGGGPGGRRGPGGPPPDFFRGGGPPSGRDGRGGPPAARITDATRFMRGIQLTAKNGVTEFTSVYPGWYSGRAIHIHLKVRLGGDPDGQRYAGGHVSHTGQLFFPEDITEEVARLEPYAKRLGVHRTTQEEDGIFRGQHGSTKMLTLERIQKGTNTGGFLAAITLAVDPEAMPAPVGMGRGGPRGGR